MGISAKTTGVEVATAGAFLLVDSAGAGRR